MATNAAEEGGALRAIMDELRQLREELVDKEGIVPNRVYPPRRAARLLGIDSVRAAQTLAETPDLAYVPSGPNGGRRNYLGRDLLAHIEARRVEKAS